MFSEILFMYKENKMGPRTDPWGTPSETDQQRLVFSKECHNQLCYKPSINQGKELKQICLQSKNLTTISKALIMSLNTLIAAVMVQFCILKPDWKGESFFLYPQLYILFIKNNAK